MAHPHPDLLLCESCGYPISEVIDQPVCPECGRPIASSLPHARPGSPWQRSPSPATFLATAWASLFAPVRTAESLTFRSRRADNLLLVLHCALASLILAFTSLGHAGSMLVLALVNRTTVRDDSAIAFESLLLTFLAAGVIAFVALLTLTQIERLGYRFLGRRRGWRIRSPITRAVCAHAAVYWVVAAALAPLGWVLARLLDPLALRLPAPAALHAHDALAYLPLAGFVLGVTLFEVVVYRGTRACRFAAPDTPIRPPVSVP